jgi:hypothetical protein
MLPNLNTILAKGESHAKERNIDQTVFLQARLAPDMFPFARQVQIATDQVKGGLARLAGTEVPSWADDEKTFAELRARVDKAIEFSQRFEAAQFDDAQARTIELKFPNATFEFTGRDYLLHFVLPNFYFHVTAAYAILRHNGVPLGKRDFAG